MSRTRLCAAILLLTLSAGSVVAVPSDLQASITGLNGGAVTIAVHNPNSVPETARARVTVVLDGGGLETLTSSNFTVSAGATVQITVSASRAVDAIDDGPDPIDPI